MYFGNFILFKIVSKSYFIFHSNKKNVKNRVAHIYTRTCIYFDGYTSTLVLARLVAESDRIQGETKVRPTDEPATSDNINVNLTKQFQIYIEAKSFA